MSKPYIYGGFKRKGRRIRISYFPLSICFSPLKDKRE